MRLRTKINIICSSIILVALSTTLSCVFSKEKKNKEQMPIDSAEKESETPDLSKYDKFQTFDEFSISGKGEAKQKPFVYVWKGQNKIIVMPSDNLTDSMVYIKHGDVWENDLALDIAKVNKPIAKDGELPARRYWRFLTNDSIFEYREIYYGSYTIKNIFIKTHKECLFISLIPQVDIIDKNYLYGQIRKLVEEYKWNKSKFLRPIRGLRFPNARTAYLYQIIERPTDFLFRPLSRNCNPYIFRKNTFGFWGIQPGFDKIDEKESYRYDIHKK